MTQTQHTKTPWKIFVYESGLYIESVKNVGFGIAQVYNEANAAFIVKACNCHEEMLAFIEKVAAWDFDGIGDYEKLGNMQKEAFALIEKVRG